jgi:hypothetical protein
MRSRTTLAATFAAACACGALGACRDHPAPSAPVTGAPRLDRGGQGGAPSPVHGDPVLDANATAACGFPVLLGFDGRLKELTLPNGRVIVAGPAFTSTLVNGRTGTTVTRSTTAAWHYNPRPGGGTELVITGNNVIILNAAELFLSSGRGTVLLDAAGNVVRDFEGVGHRTDLCALLAG